MAKNEPVRRELSYEEERAKELAEAAADEARRDAEIEAEAAARKSLASVAGDSQAQINNVLLTAIERLLTRSELQVGPTPQVPLGSFVHKTPWNPTGAPYKPLTRPTYLNGHRLREKTLTQKEIDLLNQVKPGHYNNRKWTVIEQNVNETGFGAIKIYIPNKTPEQRMAMLTEGRTLSELIGKIIAEQKAVVLAA